ncbi:hypothetical protein VE03_09187 [Pseudogymnoascus sp. 23342-1-I1]|nr:hypothetical protein VE03_09187 [Pseudogymnoascus sp. 23342-1-I1]
MVSSKSFLALSLKCLAYSMTVRPSTCSAAAPAAVLPTRRAVVAAARIHEMASDLGPQLAGSSSPPTFLAVVVPKTELDVQLTASAPPTPNTPTNLPQVHLSTTFGLPFLAISGHHGSITSLASFAHGIQISMSGFTSIALTPRGATALIGGGALSKHITDTLWAAGKHTVTGACECTSLLGPLLGGGHGWLQGRHGLCADQLVSARLVLPDGRLVVISADSAYSDLFWGLRGAGHNFGIVTQVEYKVYDVATNGGGVWTYANLVFAQDKLEAVFGVVNTITANGTGDIAYIDFVWLQRIPEIDAVFPVVNLQMVYQGPLAAAQPYIDMYAALGPANSTVLETEYTAISTLTGNGNEGIACAHGAYYALRFPTGFETYNITTNRRLFDRFAEITSAQPGFNNSFFLFEDYSTRAVEAVDAASTAFPDRYNHHLVSPVIIYFDPALSGEAVAAGRELRGIAGEGRGEAGVAYVNYAFGDEGVGGWYGREGWRGERLRGLKRRYDPEGRMGFYAPIEV